MIFNLPMLFAPQRNARPETGRGGTGAATYIGVLEGGVARSGRLISTPPVILYHVDGKGLRTALTPADAEAGRWLTIDREAAKTIREIRYYRDREHLGHPTPHWYHETTRTLLDSHGAVHSPTATLCDLAGEFICGG